KTFAKPSSHFQPLTTACPAVLRGLLTALSRAQTPPVACLLGPEPCLHEQDLGPVPARFDGELALVQDLCRATLIELGLREGAVHDEEIATKSVTELVMDGDTSIEQRGIEGSVLMDGNRVGRRRWAIARISRRWDQYRLQDVPPRIGAEGALLDRRL